MKAVGDELLVYDRRTDVAHCLTDVAALVWRRCERGATLDEVGLALEGSGFAIADDTERLAAAAVTELEEQGLLVTEYAGAEPISRRRALRRVARAGAAAAFSPLVISAMVPQSAAAKGSPGACIPLGGTCTPVGSVNANNNCCPGTGVTDPNNLYCTATGICAHCTISGGTPTPACPGGNNKVNVACCSGMCGNGSNDMKCL